MAVPNELGLHPSLSDLWDRLDSPMQIGLSLALICHAGHGLDFTRDRRLAMRFWGEFFPARIKLAARVSSTLGEFSDSLIGRLKGQVGSRYDSQRGQQQRQLWREIVTLPPDVQELVLDAFEKQASVLATLVRADVEAWREERGVTRGEASEERRDDGERRNDRGDGGNADGTSLFATGGVPGGGEGAG